MVFAWSCKQWTIPFLTLYGWWELKLRYCLVKVGLRYTDDLNPCSVCVTNPLRRSNLLSCSFSIVNCIDGWIEFTWSSNVWTFSWWGQRMNVSSIYLSHINGFSDIDPNAISSKYSMYMLANTGDNGKPKASRSSCWYIYQIPSQSRLSPYRKSTFPLDYLLGCKCDLPARDLQPVYPIQQQVNRLTTSKLTIWWEWMILIIFIFIINDSLHKVGWVLNIWWRLTS